MLCTGVPTVFAGANIRFRQFSLEVYNCSSLLTRVLQAWSPIRILRYGRESARRRREQFLKRHIECDQASSPCQLLDTLERTRQMTTFGIDGGKVPSTYYLFFPFPLLEDLQPDFSRLS